MPEKTRDQRWAAEAAAGDHEAFRALYRAHVKPVYWIAHGIVGSAQDAEDVAQETFIVAWGKLPELELVGGSILPWLATICRFHAANRRRQQIRDRVHTTHAMDDTLPDATDVEKDVIGAAVVEQILAELGTLSPLDQDIFRLCASDGYSYEDAAARLGVSHAVVRNRLSRVRGRLRTTATEARGA